MKRNLYEILDETEPKELDAVRDALNVPDPPEEVLSAVKRKVCKKTGLRMRRPQPRGAWLRVGALAACLLLFVSALALSPWIGRNITGMGIPSGGTERPAKTEAESPPRENVPPDIMLPQGEITFDSLDKVNFYGGLRVIGKGQEERTASRKHAAAGVRFLDAVGIDASIVLLSETDPRDFFEADTTSFVSDDPRETGTTDSEVSLDPFLPAWDLTGEELTITTAVYFQIRVTEHDTLLAAEIGTGEAEVVVTDLSIGINPFAMITFKNGERFFSCLSEMYALRNGENTFGSHLYIRGFEMFKDPVGEMTSYFSLMLDREATAIHAFRWTHYNREPNESVPHEIEILSETVTVCEGRYVFTLEELSDYWKEHGETEKSPEVETGVKPPSPPELYDDGMLRYYLVDGEFYEVGGIYNSGYRHLVIPETLFGYPIKRIRDCAFRNYGYLESVVIPDSVTDIGDYAFYNCDRLESITMPQDVRLGADVFGKDDESSLYFPTTDPFSEPDGTLLPEDEDSVADAE